MNDKGLELEKVLGSHHGERHVIVIQDFPDSDAIAAAFTHQLISVQYNIGADIFYWGKINNPQDMVLVKLLDIELIRYSDSLDFSGYDASIFINTQGATTTLTKILNENNIKPILVIDHHEEEDFILAEFYDIRKTSSTSSIYTDYLKKGLLKLERTNPSHVKCATALTYGIWHKTDRYVWAKEEDYQAVAFLSNYADSGLLEEIVNQSRSKKVMDVIQRVLENRIIKQNYSISGIGYLRMEDSNAIHQAADFLLTEENVHTAIVYAILLNGNREILSGSFRTTKLTLDPDDFLREAFGRGEIEVYYEGKSQKVRGFEIPIFFLAGTGGEEYNVLKWKVYDMQVKQKLFNKIGVSEETEKE
jgi:nanoRNase/pAp phosphatase (c-di-AMP/oligoRNAs hydrolase)